MFVTTHPGFFSRPQVLVLLLHHDSSVVCGNSSRILVLSSLLTLLGAAYPVAMVYSFFIKKSFCKRGFNVVYLASNLLYSRDSEHLPSCFNLR